MPEVRFLRRLEQAALSWNNNRTKRGRLRGRLGVSGAPLTFAGPQVSSLRLWLGSRPRRLAGCVCQGENSLLRKRTCSTPYNQERAPGFPQAAVCTPSSSSVTEPVCRKLQGGNDQKQLALARVWGTRPPVPACLPNPAPPQWEAGRAPAVPGLECRIWTRLSW